MNASVAIPADRTALPTARRDARAVGLWLMAVAGLVFLMIVVGGITRLTESGLSMTDWRPVTGIVPPLSEEAWAKSFEAYKQFPEYKVLNRGMSLAEYKTIFWWEYVHRLLGRLIGLAFALPLAFFWLRGRVPQGFKGRLLGLLALGALQGLLGWFMVKSGLVDEPEVSHYRLTAHLTLAFVIFAALWWSALDLLAPHHRGQRTARLRGLAHAFIALLFLQIAMGGLVAGLKAGYAYNTWPLMDGAVVPAHMFDMTPWWTNLLDNTATVQFDHRIGAYLLFALAAFILWRALRGGAPAASKAAAGMVMLAVTGQTLLGILTLVNAVPIALGAMHQAGGVIVLAAALVLAHMQRRGPDDGRPPAAEERQP